MQQTDAQKTTIINDARRKSIQKNSNVVANVKSNSTKGRIAVLSPIFPVGYLDPIQCIGLVPLTHVSPQAAGYY